MVKLNQHLPQHHEELSQLQYQANVAHVGICRLGISQSDITSGYLNDFSSSKTS